MLGKTGLVSVDLIKSGSLLYIVHSSLYIDQFPAGEGGQTEWRVGKTKKKNVVTNQSFSYFCTVVPSRGVATILLKRKRVFAYPTR